MNSAVLSKRIKVLCRNLLLLVVLSSILLEWCPKLHLIIISAKRSIRHVIHKVVQIKLFVISLQWLFRWNLWSGRQALLRDPIGNLLNLGFDFFFCFFGLNKLYVFASCFGLLGLRLSVLLDFLFQRVQGNSGCCFGQTIKSADFQQILAFEIHIDQVLSLQFMQIQQLNQLSHRQSSQISYSTQIQLLICLVLFMIFKERFVYFLLEWAADNSTTNKTYQVIKILLSHQYVPNPNNYIIKLKMSNRKERKPLPYAPNTYASMRDQGSPTKASVLLQQDHAEYIQSLQSRKQNFCTCLQLYRVSYQNQLPQKCLIHNNFITLYCENEFKLLCVNCIYGSAIHKDHRVIPSKNSVGSIAKDNEDNLRILDEELERIKYVDVEMRKNKKTLDQEYNMILKQIQDQFKEIYLMLEKKHKETRQRVVQAFNRAANINDTGIKEMSWWKELLAKTRTTLPKPSNNEQTEVYKHLVLDLFMQQKIDEEKLTYLPSGQQIRTQFLRELTELRELLEQHIGPTYQSQKSKSRMF